MNSKINFFIGKGGVGKSTTSALTALYSAHTGSDTLLVSMDPAHNQRDIFQQDFSDKAKKVIDNLWVREVDTDHWTNVYLKDAVSHLKKAYSYQSAFNIQNYYEILKYSPGLEEYAMLLAFEDILHSNMDKENIIFDMPPTALTLRFISLPFITLIWLEELSKLRNQIYKKKEIVSKIKIGKREIEQDKVKARLVGLIESYTHLRNHFTDDTFNINLVLNNEMLSFSEAVRVKQKLSDIGISVNRILINKIKNSEIFEDIKSKFNGYPMIRFPHSDVDLFGIESLMEYVLDHFDEMNLLSEIKHQ